MAIARYADAIIAYRRAADLHSTSRPCCVWSKRRIGLASDSAAANVLALFLSQNPQNVAALRLSAHWQIADGDWDSAIDTLEDLRARIGNRDAALLAELAYAYVGDDDPDAGLVFAKAAYRLAPMSPAATDAYGWALYQQGNSGPALQLFQKAASIAPDHAVLHWHLGQAYADLGRNAEAVAQIRAALADPAFTDRIAASAALKALG